MVLDGRVGCEQNGTREDRYAGRRGHASRDFCLFWAGRNDCGMLVLEGGEDGAGFFYLSLLRVWDCRCGEVNSVLQ